MGLCVYRCFYDIITKQVLSYRVITHSPLMFGLSYELIASTYVSTMDTRILTIVLGIVVVLSIVAAFPHLDDVRHRRSPQNDNPWCRSPFLSFAKFSPRMCPKPPLCKLSRPLKFRKCS